MDNPYLEKARRAVDERIERPPEEIQALALVAIAVELRALRQQLATGDAPLPAEPPVAMGVMLDDLSDGIVIG